MISHVDYFKVGTAEEIRQHGYVKVYLMGWEVMVLAAEKEFFAIEIGEVASHAQKSFLADEVTYSRSGVRKLVDRVLLGPAGSIWGRLRYFPVRIEDDFVLVGVISRA